MSITFKRVAGIVLLVLVALGPAGSVLAQPPSSLEAEAVQLRDEVYRLQSQGKYRDAIPKAERLVKVAEQLFHPGHATVVNLMDLLADLYELSNRHQEARQLRKKIAAINDPKTRDQAIPRVDRLIIESKSYFDRGDYESAFDNVISARRLLESDKMQGTVQYAVVMNEMGRIAEALIEFRAAEGYYLKSARIAEENDAAGEEQLAVALSNLGLLYSKTARYDDAEKALSRALAIDQKLWGRHGPESVPTIINLGFVYSLLGQHDQALQKCLQARDIIIKTFGEEHHYLIQIYDNLAALSWKRKDPDATLEWQGRANRIAAAAIADNIVLGSEHQKHRYMAKFIDSGDATISLSLGLAKDRPQAGKIAFESILHRKSRVMDTVTDSLKRVRTSMTTAELKLFEEYVNLQKAKAEMIYRPESPGAARQIIPAYDQAWEKQLLKYLGNRNKAFKELFHDYSLEDIQNLLPQSSALLEFVLYNPKQPTDDNRRFRTDAPHYAVYLLKSSGELQWRDLGEKKALERFITDFQSGLTDPRKAYVRDMGQELFRQIMLPLQPYLTDIEFLFIAPDGALNLIPFGALIDASGKYLVQQYTFINYLSSGRDLVSKAAASAPGDTVVIVADPDYGKLKGGEAAPCTDSDRRSSLQLSAGFQRLCGTKMEAAAISKNLPEAKVLSGPAATETVVKNLTHPTILHMATHGFFLADVLLPETGSGGSPTAPSLSSMDKALLRSGLVLAGANQRRSGLDDGILTALEAMGLNLTGTRLVVLSACETGLGEVVAGEGVFGLRRALAIAGAESQVMSLWKVSDTVTAGIMARYYELLRADYGRSQSLCQTQREYLRAHQGLQAHPYYWAGFIPSGDWRPLPEVKFSR